MLTYVEAENNHGNSNIMLMFNHGFASLASRLHGTQVHNMAERAAQAG